MTEFREVVFNYIVLFDEWERTLGDRYTGPNEYGQLRHPEQVDEAQQKLYEVRQRFNSMVHRANKVTKQYIRTNAGYEGLLHAEPADITQYASGMSNSLRLVFNDLITQTIAACEVAEQSRPSAIAKTATQGLSFFTSIFKTDVERAALRWLIYILLSGAIARFIFGFPLEKVAQYVLQLANKKIEP